MIFDITQADSTLLVASLKTPGWPLAVEVCDNLLFLADDTNLGIYDVGDAMSVDPVVSNEPQTISLISNYPNPFNSSTTLSFSLPTPGSVTLSIYNTSGQLVDVLVDQQMPAGAHSVVWEADDAIAGVYLVRMKDEGGSMKDVKKVVLVK